MRRTLKMALLASMALSLSNCVSYSLAVESVQGKAYIIKNDLMSGSALYNCDASGAEPTCYRAVETPLGGAPAK